MNTLKIGIVTPTFPPKVGGIATAHYNIYHLLKEDYTVRVFAYDDHSKDDNPDVIRKNTPPFLLPLIKLFYKLYIRKYKQNIEFINLKRVLQYSVGAWLLNGSIKKFSPDILIVPDNNIPLYWIKKRSIRIIWFSRNNYLRFRDNPLITNYSHVDIDIVRSMENKAVKKADLVLSPSHYMIREYERAYNHKSDIVVINNFIFKEKLEELFSGEHFNKTKFPRTTVFLPSAGTINKGSRYTFEIIRRMGYELNYEIDFCITGPVVNELKYELKYIDERSKIYMPGHLSWEDNLEYLNSSTLVVSPTLVENYSNAFVEAFVLGKPIVTFDVGGNKEIIDNGQNGYVVPYLDIDELVRKSVSLLKDKQKLDQFCQNAIEKADLLCDLDRKKEEYSQVFRDIMNNG